MHFTIKTIEALKAKEIRYEKFDDNLKGFGVRVSPSGEKSWITRYRRRSKLIKVTHGKVAALSLADARDKHNEVRLILNLGRDPQAEAQANKILVRESPTVEELAQDYLERWAKPRKRTWKTDEWVLNKYVVPRFGKMLAKDVKRVHIIAMLDEAVALGLTAGANNVLSITRKMFNWAVGRGILEMSPCHLIPRPAPLKQRDRVLTYDEIATLWKSLPKLGFIEQVRLALQIMLVTAQRKSEVLKAEKTEIDFRTSWWTIPAERAKNGLSHRVPLSPLALRLFQKAFDLSGDSRWVFNSPYKSKEDRHLNPQSISQSLLKNKEKMDIDTFVVHDLRRTAASYMASMGIPRLVIKKILNHVETDVTAVYDRHSYDKEKHEALIAWGEKLENIVTIDTHNVVPFRRKQQ